MNRQLAFILSLFAAVALAITVRSLASNITDARTSAWAGLIICGITASVGLYNQVVTGIKTTLDIRKTVQEIQLNKRKLEEQDRRVVEPTPMTTSFKWGDPFIIKPPNTGESEEGWRGPHSC